MTDHVETLKRVYDEWAVGNLRAGLELLDPHIVYINRPGLFVTGTCYGLEAMQEWMRDFLNVWTRYEAHAIEFLPAGDSVVVAFQQVAMGSGSGTPGEMTTYAIWTFRGEKVIRLEKTSDRAEALQAVGLEQ